MTLQEVIQRDHKEQPLGDIYMTINVVSVVNVV